MAEKDLLIAETEEVPAKILKEADWQDRIQPKMPIRQKREDRLQIRAMLYQITMKML